MRSILLFAFVVSVAYGFVQPIKPSSSHYVNSNNFWQQQQNAVTFKKRRVATTSIGSTISSNNDMLPGIQAINTANTGLLEKLEQLKQNPYFRLYSVDILASCEYLPQELFECYSETCEIYPVDEDEVRIMNKKAKGRMR